MANKIKYGLSNVYYAIMTNRSSNTYSTPVKIDGAVSIALSQSGEQTPIYADNVEYFKFNSNNGYDGTIEFVLLPDSFKVDVLGEILDNNGIQTESAETAIDTQFALMFQFEGDVNNKRHVLYCCSCSRPNIESSTKGSKNETKNDILTISARPRMFDKKVKACTTLTADTDLYDRWFTGVFPELIPSLTVASAAGTSRGTTTITVSESLSGSNTYIYKTGAIVTYPALGEVCLTANGWIVWNGEDDITAVASNDIVIVEVDADDKAVKAGKATVVINSGV